ncbi:UvrD-helicase domain-containing protein [Jatrophihabitans sp. YIM 134969]
MTAVRVVSALDLAEIFDPASPKRPTGEQREIIESPLAPAAVVAGAGSGKTETMATRVVWLVANGLVAPERILGLTFTRKAAAELAERVRRRLAAWRSVQPGPVPLGEPTVSTYAAYAGQLVSEHAVRLGREPMARLLSAASDWQVARDVVGRWDGVAPEAFGTPATVVKLLMALSGRMSDHLVDPADVVRIGADLARLVEALPAGEKTRSPYPKGTGDIAGIVARRAALVPLVEEFTRAKEAGRARDFADEMTLAARLAAIDVVRAAERERYGAVLLDEYQDTGFAQVEMLRRLFDSGHPVMAVGDPLQSIYGWRGASTGTMTGFAPTFRHEDDTPATVFRLQTSWRNDRAVLDVANRIAGPLHDPSISVELAARGTAGPGTVRVVRTESVLAEAEWVAEALQTTWDTLPPGTRTAAVLVRKRSQIPLLEQALRWRGLPVEVVDLGGLLTVPEVADVYATLQVVADHTAGAALARLLTGARWRIGVRDLQALQQRARWLLADRRAPDAPVHVGAVVADADAGTDKDPLGEATHLVEALDDLGPEQAYSPEGHRRLVVLQAELRRLRARAAAPLPELVADIEHTTGLDVEVAARPDVHGRPDRGRAHLDRFLAEVTRFADEVDHATLAGFVAFLAAAEEEENGLGAGEVEVDPERVQVLTVHGSKGLEWDVVAVPGLVEQVFPGAKVDDDWVKAPAHLPDSLRGDADHIPHLDLSNVASRNDVGDRVKRYHDALRDRRREEERRLAYVAVTRARSTLLASGYVWDHTTKPRGVSEFLEEIRATVGEAEIWCEDADVPENPAAARVVETHWPFDPLGQRRPAVESGAALVRAAVAAARAGRAPAPVSDRAQLWAHDADLLLAERDRLAEGRVVEVDMPAHLSVSALVALRRDPDALARSLRRRMPTRPNLRARRGTAFHQWLEQRWLPKADALLDVDELPGAADESVTTSGATELAALRAAFEASAWADREPHAVEVPFEMLVGGRVVRGRMDAVFLEPDATGAGSNDRWLVVDWKTGPPPSGEGAAAAAVQLAAYRLAWADLQGVPVERVDAAFHHVLADVTVRPADLLDADQLHALLAGVDDGPDPGEGDPRGDVG